MPIDTCEIDQATDAVVQLAQVDLDTGIDVHLCNAYTLALADKDPRFLSMLRQASLNLADGTPLVWVNRLLHREIVTSRKAVRGPDLFLETFEHGQEVALRHYLLGSTREVLDALQRNLRRRFPQAQIVGAESPPFRELAPDEFEAQVARIRESKAQVVWVGLGTPKQDWHVARLASELPVVSVAVGAAFDFAAGTKEQAPRWMRQRGLEWLHRLASEPGRLWKRYLFGNARFVYAACVRRG